MTHFSGQRKKLLGALIGLARSLDETNSEMYAYTAAVEGLRALESGDDALCAACLEKVRAAKQKAVPDCFVCQNPCGRTADYDTDTMARLDDALCALKYDIINALIKAAFCVRADGKNFAAALNMFKDGLFAVGYDYFAQEQLKEILTRITAFCKSQ